LVGRSSRNRGHPFELVVIERRFQEAHRSVGKQDIRAGSEETAGHGGQTRNLISLLA